MAHYTTKIEKPLSLDEARQNATQMANETGNPQPVYKVEEIETVSPSYIKGRWYYGDNGSFTWVCRFQYSQKMAFYYSEFYNNIGTTKTNDFCSVRFIKGVATPEQIEAHLSAAAIKMGFKEGVWFESPVNMFIDVCDGVFVYDQEYDLLSSNGTAIYNGMTEQKWATILPNNEEQQQPAKEDKNPLNPVLLSYRDEQGTIVNIRATEVKINPLEGE